MSENLIINENLSYNYVPSKENSLPHYSDKIILPQSVLESLVNQQRALSLDYLPHPLIFKLSTIPNSVNENELSCFVGVKEFSSNKGEVELPHLITEKLQLNNTSCTLNLSLIQTIPKGKQLSLKPLKIYNEIKDWKWFLEAKLTKYYTTLSTNNLLILKDNEKLYKLEICDAEPSDTICIIDTDIDLDIVPLDDLMANELLNNNQDETKEFKLVKINESIKLNNDDKLRLDIGDEANFKQLIFESDSDFVIDNSRFIAKDSFIWSTFNQGVKRIEIDKTNEFLKNELYIIPIGEEGSTIEFMISTDLINEFNIEETGDDQDDKLYKVCSNCSSKILKSSSFMHENFCQRNNVKCLKGCNKIFLKTIPGSHWHCCDSFGDSKFSHELHMKYCHKSETLLRCSRCSNDNSSTLLQLSFHKSVECPLSLHECKFCHLITPKLESTIESKLSGLSQHEYECGSKTSNCLKCNKLIKLKDFDVHYQLHELHRINKPTPIKCSNVNCIRIVSNNTNQFQLCDFCYGPLYSSVNDSNLIKLKSRIERKYVLQLSKGCGNSFCKNLYCKSSGLNNKLIKIDEIIKFVKNNLINFDNFWFCVDISTTRKKLYIDLLSEDKELLDYNYGWICKGISVIPFNSSNNNNDFEYLQRIKSWVHENGVTNHEI